MPFLLIILRNYLIKLTGGYIMKKILINWILPTVYDALLSALTGLSKRSDNTVDDALVKALNTNRDEIMTEIKASL